jgi:hypothetical protein
VIEFPEEGPSPSPSIYSSVSFTFSVVKNSITSPGFRSL